MRRIETAPPAVVMKTMAVPVCPAELRAPVGNPPKVPDGALIKASPQGHAWISAMVAYAKGLRALLADAQSACPAQASPVKASPVKAAGR